MFTYCLWLFHTTTVEFSNCNRAHTWPAKPNRLTVFYRKSADSTLKAIPCPPGSLTLLELCSQGQPRAQSTLALLPIVLGELGLAWKGVHTENETHAGELAGERCTRSGLGRGDQGLPGTPKLPPWAHTCHSPLDIFLPCRLSFSA